MYGPFGFILFTDSGFETGIFFSSSLPKNASSSSFELVVSVLETVRPSSITGTPAERELLKFDKFFRTSASISLKTFPAKSRGVSFPDAVLALLKSTSYAVFVFPSNAASSVSSFKSTSKKSGSSDSPCKSSSEEFIDSSVSEISPKTLSSSESPLSSESCKKSSSSSDEIISSALRGLSLSQNGTVLRFSFPLSSVSSSLVKYEASTFSSGKSGHESSSISPSGASSRAVSAVNSSSEISADASPVFCSARLFSPSSASPRAPPASSKIFSNGEAISDEDSFAFEKASPVSFASREGVFASESISRALS